MLGGEWVRSERARPRFRLLGALQVLADGRELHVGGLYSQRIFAMLLLNANQVVTVARLGEAAWGADLPETAHRQVRNRISGLRRLLTGAGVVIETNRPGYRVLVDPEDLDVLVFDRLVEQARTAKTPRQGARMLRDALACWRGPALEGLGEPLRSESTVLEEKRLAAVARCIDLEIAAGDHATTLPELRRLNAEHPLHEGFAARLMVALRREGRQNEALAIYRRLRRRLVAELGVEPGIEVRQLNEATIKGEAAEPATIGAAAQVASDGLPHELLGDVAAFTGRDNELARLRQVLAEAGESGVPGILAVHGAGGIGKSALTIHAAHQLAHGYPDGQLYVDLQGATDGLRPLTPLNVLRRFLRVLDPRGGDIPFDLSEGAGRFRSVTATRRILIVLDNARDAAQVAPLLPSSATCAVLVTSRRMLASLSGAHHLHLGVLSDADALEYLARISGVEQIANDPAATEIIHWCGNLPLALRIAGAKLAARPGLRLRDLADRLADARRRLDTLEFTDISVRSSVEVSLHELRRSSERSNRAAADALVMLSVLDAPSIEVRAAARVLEASESATEHTLEKLVDVSLLENVSVGRYRLHDLVRLYARERALEVMPAEHQAAALNRVLAMYIATAWNASTLIRPGDFRAGRRDPRWVGDSLTIADSAAALDWLEAEHVNLLSAIRQAASTPGVAAEAATQLSQAVYAFLRLRGHWSDMAESSRIALTAARSAGNRAAEAAVRNDLGAALCKLGHFAEAIDCLSTGLIIHRELGDRDGEAQCLSNIGVAHKMNGRLDSALACYQESLAIHETIGNRRGQAMSLGNLGPLHRIQGRYTEALACHQRGLELFRLLGDRYGQAVGLVELGMLYGQTGRPAEALTCLNDSLATYREMGDRHGEAEALCQLGVIQRDIDLPEQALIAHQVAITLSRKSDLRLALAHNLREMGRTLHALGRREEARAAWSESLTIFTELHTSDAVIVAALLEKAPW